MALTGNISSSDTSVGIEVNGSYLRILNINLNNNVVSISLEGYATEQARIDSLNPVYYDTVEVDLLSLTGTGNIKQICYAYLKTLPKFNTFTDN